MPNCTDRATLEAEHVENVSRQDCQTMRRCFQLYTSFHGLPSENLDDYKCEVEALVTRSKDDEKQLIGTRLVRRLGEVPGALAVEKVYMPDLAKSEKIKLIKVFPGNKRQEKTQERCSGQETLRDSPIPKPSLTVWEERCKIFFATENTAYGDDVKARVRIDPDKLAHHMIVRSGLADHQINDIYGFVHDAEMATLDTRKIQEPALRFYDKPWDVDRHCYPNACLGRYSRPLMGPVHCGSIGSLAKTPDVDSTSDQCQQKQRRARALERR